MPAISYKEWGGGLDRRLPLGVQDANRLWILVNAFITSGKKISKRPGLSRVSNGLSPSVGLKSINDQLTVFVKAGTAFTPPTGVAVIALTGYDPLASGSTSLNDVLYAEQYQGFPYVVAKYFTTITGPSGPMLGYAIRHSYVDGSPSTLITDVNCPHGASVTKAASRIYSIGGEVVRYCAAGLARNWTLASDAGFLPTGIQQNTTTDCTAVGTFENSLVVFFAEGMQMWTVNVDPSSNELQRATHGVGTQHPQSLSSFYKDLVFASPYGSRSLAVQETVDRIDENDIGVPIDGLVTATQQTHEAQSAQTVRGIWIQQFGQYWVLYDNGGFTTIYAYTYSKSSKLACWSVYTFGILITGVATAAGKVYVRDTDTLYEFEAIRVTDAGEAIPVEVLMAFQDAKLPGVEKMWYGADYVFSGSPTVSYLYDPRDTTKETIGQVVSGDTRAGQLVPVEVTSAAIAPHFLHSADEAFTLDLATLYFHSLAANT